MHRSECKCTRLDIASSSFVVLYRRPQKPLAYLVLDKAKEVNMVLNVNRNRRLIRDGEKRVSMEVGEEGDYIPIITGTVTTVFGWAAMRAISSNVS